MLVIFTFTYDMTVGPGLLLAGLGAVVDPSARKVHRAGPQRLQHRRHRRQHPLQLSADADRLRLAREDRLLLGRQLCALRHLGVLPPAGAQAVRMENWIFVRAAHFRAEVQDHAG